MKVRVTYEESITYTQVVDIDDAEYHEWAENMVISPTRVKEFLMSGEEWEQSLSDARTMRNTEVDYVDIRIEEVEVIIL